MFGNASCSGSGWAGVVCSMFACLHAATCVLMSHGTTSTTLCQFNIVRVRLGQFVVRWHTLALAAAIPLADGPLHFPFYTNWQHVRHAYWLNVRHRSIADGMDGPPSSREFFHFGLRCACVLAADRKSKESGSFVLSLIAEFNIIFQKFRFCIRCVWHIMFSSKSFFIRLDRFRV